MKRKLGKSIVSMVLAAVMCFSLLPMSAFAADSDFVIENGVLTEYKGNGGNVTIPDGVTSIGNDVCSFTSATFKDYRNITSVTIPESVTSIGVQAFCGTSIKTLTIPNSVTYISESAFAGCDKLTDITIGTGTKIIDNYAFSSCDNLTRVTIPKNVESIGRHVFYEVIQEVPLKNVTIYGEVNTAAERYAKEQGITFVSTGEATKEPTKPTPTTTPEKPTELTPLTEQMPGQQIQLTKEEFKWYVEFMGYLHEMKAIIPIIADSRATLGNGKDYASKELKPYLDANRSSANMTVLNAKKVVQRFPGEINRKTLSNLDILNTGFESLTGYYVDDYDFKKYADTIEGAITATETMYISLYGPIYSTTTPTTPTTPTTTDKPSAWAEAQVNTAIAANIVPQALQGKYTQVTTRAEFAALAVALYEKVKGAEIAERQTFSDTTDINVQKAAAIGVVSGVGNNNFAPNDKLTREQAATMLSRLAAAIGKPLTEQAATFADNNKVSSWASAAVGQAQASGIMGGVGNNTFAPQDDYTREQSIITITRLFDIVK